MITNKDIPEDDGIFDPGEFDNDVNTEIAMDRHNDGTGLVRVNKRIKDKDSIPIGIAADNPILDMRMFEFEYADGYKTSITTNAIASNIFSQVYQYVQRFLLFNAIVDLRTEGTYIKEGGSFIHMSNGNKRRRYTTKGWEVCIQYKDGSSNWNQVKDVKESLPVQLS